MHKTTLASGGNASKAVDGSLSTYWDGGPVSDEWIQDTVQMARVNQRKISVLGMQPCLQGFMGAMPERFADVANGTLMNTYGFEDIKPYMVAQGTWSSFTRPPILKTTYNGYVSLAKKFYDTQELIYGQVTNYYAGDLAHEGGIIPPDLSKPEMSAHILNQMMSYDKDAVWVIQSWLSNPDPKILEGFKENKQDHVIVLDLDATKNPHWSNTTNWNGKEFGGTSWVYCMLDNYGGRQGMHGELKCLATQISKARKESKHMKGIGITPEGTLLNPVNYDLFWEMGCKSVEKDTEQWLKDYITRRYGTYNENLWKAWQILLTTAYGSNNPDGTSKYHTGNVNCITNMRPGFDPSIVIGSYKLTYDPIQFEKATNLFMGEFETFKTNECYIYDCVDMLRQMVANSQVELFKRVVEGYENNNRAIFLKYKTKLLNSILLLDEIAGFQKDSLYGTWIQKARNFYQDERNSKTYDDYAKDMMEINAKAIVSIWSSKSLQTYAYRQYAGLERDYNYPMWKLWLDTLDEAMTTGNLKPLTSNHDYFNCGWKVVINDKNYETTVKAVDGTSAYRGLVAIYDEMCKEYLTASAQKDEIVDENVAPLGTTYADTTLGSYVPSRINDQNSGSMWIAKSNAVPVKVGIEFKQIYHVYNMQLTFETRPTLGANVMNYYIEMLDETGTWKKVYTGQSYDPKRKSYTINIAFDQPIATKNVRMTYTSNGGIYPALQEMKIYSSKGIQLVGGTTMFIDGQVLAESAIVSDQTKVQLVKDGTLIQELSISLASHLKNELKEVLIQAKAIEPTNYSTSSYATLQEAIQKAQTVYDDQNAVAEQYLSQIMLVTRAMNDLVDIIKFKSLMKQLENQPANRYNSEYYALSTTYYKKAKAVYDHLETASNTEIYTACGNAETALNYLIHDNNTNIAIKGTSYSENELSAGYGKKNLNNNRFTDCWVANSRSNYLVYAGITLDQKYAVDQIKVVFEQNGHRNTQLGFDVLVKDEKDEWKTIYTGKTGAKEGYTFKIDVKGMMVKDVRVSITSYATDKDTPYPGIAELAVYEKTNIQVLKDACLVAEEKMKAGYTQETTTKQTWDPFYEAYEFAQWIMNTKTYTQAKINEVAKTLETTAAALRLDVLEPMYMSATLTDKISVNVYMNIPKAVMEDKDASITFTLPNGNGSKNYRMQDLQANKKGLYKVSMPLSARMMSDDVTMLVHTSKEDQTYHYTIKGYGNAVLASTTTTKVEKEAVEAMLNYGAMAQLYFAYNTDNLANAKVVNKAYESVTAERLQTYKGVAIGKAEGIAYGASNLRLLSETAIRHHFVTGQNLNDYNFTLVLGEKEEALVPHRYDGNKAYVEIGHVYAENLNCNKKMLILLQDKHFTYRLKF